MHIEENGSEIIITRTYDAPKELVFSMFHSPNIEQWWGPTHWPVNVSNMAFRPGGTWHYNMVGPNGEEGWSVATYEEIDEPNKIVFTDAFSDADGNVNTELPQSRTVLTFEENAGKTTLTLRGNFHSPEQRQKVVAMGMLEGMKDTWNQLEQLLRKMQQ